MTEENISSVVTKFEDCISKEQQAELKQQLQSVPEEKYEAVSAVKTKSTKMTTVLSAVLGLFGAGSFYLGLFKRGICKVVFNVILPLTLGLILLYWFAPLYKEYSVQTKDISSAVTENRQYEYSFDSLKSIHFDYSESYKTFSGSIVSIDKETQKLVSVKDYLLEKTEEIKNSETNYFMFIGQVTELIQDSVINDLTTEIGNSLEILDGLTEEEKEDNKDLFDLVNEVDKIVAACNFLASSESITEYAESISVLIPKIENLIAAKSFEEVNSALNEITPLLKLASQNNKFISYISKSKVEELKNQLDTLNELTVKTQNDKNDIIVDNSDNTSLALAIAEFESIYNEFYGTQIGDDTGIEGYVEELVKNADASEILASIINSVYADEGSSVAVSVNDMQLQKDKFILNETYFKYLNTDYINNLRFANERLAEVNKNEVENRISLSNTLSEICSSLESIKSETNIEAVQSGMDKVVNNLLSGLQNRLDEAHYHYWFGFMFVDIYFAIMLSIDGIVIVAYWIFDVFRNREKCQNANYLSIVQALQ